MSEKDSPSLYETVLKKVASAWRGGTGQQGAPAPRSSAAVVPWRRHAGTLEVYWVRRSDGLAFMGGWHAFPGGGVARTDAAIPLAGQPVAALTERPVAQVEEQGPDL